MKIEIKFEEYQRFEGGAVRTARVERENLLECLKVVLDNVGTYLSREEVEEEELTTQEALNRLEESNGDGCDFIYYIKNLETNEMYLETNYEPEVEEW